MNKDKEFIEKTLLMQFANLGMDRPTNMNDIVQFCYDDIKVSAAENWHSGDIIIALRRWIESTPYAFEKYLKAHDLLDRIDYSELRNQKTEIINMLEGFVLKENQVDALNGILNLIDNVQDYAVDDLGLDENYVFDLDAEEKEEELFSPQTKTVRFCSHCASDNIVHNNTKSGLYYCLDCQKNTESFTDDIPSEKYVLGYQVIHVLDIQPLEAEFHPKGGEFKVFSLKQAREMIKDDPNQWQLFTIWSGDFKNLEIMFEGDCR
jgi:hypothetical protein